MTASYSISTINAYYPDDPSEGPAHAARGPGPGITIEASSEAKRTAVLLSCYVALDPTMHL